MGFQVMCFVFFDWVEGTLSQSHTPILISIIFLVASSFCEEGQRNSNTKYYLLRHQIQVMVKYLIKRKMRKGKIVYCCLFFEKCLEGCEHDVCVYLSMMCLR